MARVITFSRQFPSYHPRKGDPTYFVEKFYKSFAIDFIEKAAFYGSLKAKHHTIRAGHRWKAGDWFSPKVWGTDINPKSGRSGPYHSKQIQFAPDIQIEKVWDFDIEGTDFFLNGKHEHALTGEGFDFDLVAQNDGLSNVDLFDWFCLSPDFKKKKAFYGQIICWNETIEY